MHIKSSVVTLKRDVLFVCMTATTTTVPPSTTPDLSNWVLFHFPFYLSIILCVLFALLSVTFKQKRAGAP